MKQLFINLLLNMEKTVLNRRKLKERRQRKEIILDAACRVFSKLGFEKTKVETIAKEAEFSVGAIYNFFDSKEIIYERILDKFFKDFLDAMEKNVLSQDTFNKALSEYIDLRINFYKRYKYFFSSIADVISQKEIKKRDRLKIVIFDFKKRYFKKIEQIFMKDGSRLKDVDTKYMSLILDGAVHSLLCHFWIEGKNIDKNKDKLIKTFEQLFNVQINL